MDLAGFQPGSKPADLCLYGYSRSITMLSFPLDLGGGPADRCGTREALPLVLGHYLPWLAWCGRSSWSVNGWEYRGFELVMFDRSCPSLVGHPFPARAWAPSPFTTCQRRGQLSQLAWRLLPTLACCCRFRPAPAFSVLCQTPGHEGMEVFGRRGGDAV